MPGIATSAAEIVSSDIAFTPTVKAIQSRKGSRRSYAGMEQRGSWPTEITDGPESLYRGADQRIPRDRDRRRPTLYPASRGACGFLRVPMTARSVSPTLPATGNTSPRAISSTIRKRFCS